jgi:hypothetical protein
MIELMIDQRRRDIGGFEVGRVLPFAKWRMVGPFILFDHMGPIDLPTELSREVDMRPHPHIGLSTVTYVFAGEIIHRRGAGYPAWHTARSRPDSRARALVGEITEAPLPAIWMVSSAGAAIGSLAPLD